MSERKRGGQGARATARQRTGMPERRLTRCSRASREHTSQSGQALIEAALTLPVLFLLLLGFYEVALAVQSDVDLGTSVALASASAATAPAGNAPRGQEYASQTFTHTIAHFPLLQRTSIVCSGSFMAGSPVTCTGQATLQLGATPFAAISPSIPLTRQSTAYLSPYRSQGPP